MRGKAGVCVLKTLQTWITTAYAGKRLSAFVFPVYVGDHPRVCGEKGSFFFVSSLELGSPPRMRGKEEPTETEIGYCRITPAYAGKSFILPHGYEPC